MMFYLLNLDWIGIFPSGAAVGGYVSWQYINSASGSLSFILNIPRTYEARYFKIDGFTRVATSQSFIIESGTIGGGGGGIFTITISSQTVPANSNINVQFQTSGHQSSTDWIGVYKVGTSDSQYLNWQYTNGLQSDVLTFTAPSESGNYEFRYFLNNGFERVATSLQFSVNADIVPCL